jgi:hypothetical protein
MFQLSLHLFFFALREHRQEGSTQQHGTDLSFLAYSNFPERKRYMMVKSRFSLVISGSGDRHWTAYAFVDDGFDEDQDLEIEFLYDGVHEDPIASDCGLDVIDANQPIWDPREYFLAIFEIRIKHVLREWLALSQLIGSRIDIYVRPCLLSL